ncbi:autotransporter strand-loop-strand O-heptosyltransferase [Anaerovibrio lipolyticus]|uniref:autotransporter strand-loop-strand O-heptosyltransferase n=1 Tax=Anaerovibrio lipolyticus TaxID=82374 RepID=UPI0009DFB743|nr:autotransporter strand-loop-strand O-heptosyltransferase [Anaerovibrio lipolyticus]
MHKYPIFYFSIRKDEIEPEQVNRLLNFEQAVGDVKLQTGIEGLYIDFNGGARVEVPAGNWHIKISDFDTGMVGFDGDISEQILVSLEKYYIHWYVEAWLDGKKVFEHLMDLHNKDIYIFMVDGVLGDTISVLPYINALKAEYNANITLYPPNSFKDLCKEYMSGITIQEKIPSGCYASFCLAVFDLPPYLIPDDSRHWPPYKSAQVILGLYEKAPEIHYYPTAPREIKEKYVCIGVQASGIMKRWLYPDGWDIVVEYLKSLGYRVLCIDGGHTVIENGIEISMPAGAEDFTGMRPLMERVNLLAYADFFIGLGSGLSWLANACGIPVVLISGFSLPMGEFETPYRVTNQLVCHGCYNDIRVNWKDICPYHKGTDREFECSKSITPLQVVQAVDRLIEDKGL